MTEYILPFRTGQKIVELGGGERPLFHPNYDTRKLPTVDHIIDFNNFPLHIADNNYEGIFSSYVLEHVSYRNIKTFIKESFRILKPNSIAIFVTANLLNQCKRIVDTINNGKEWEEEFSSLIFGGQDYIENSHKVGFSPEYAIKLFKEAGYNKVEIFDHPQSNTDMIIQATKSDITDAIFKEISPTADSNIIKINVGSFTVMHANNWVNLDILDLTEYAKQNNYIFKRVDCSNNIPYENNSVSILTASHFLEHINRDEGKQFLKEVFRVLKPGGITRLTVPDAKIIAQDYLAGTISRHGSHNVEVKNAEDDVASLFHLLIGGHQTGYDLQSLKKILENIGFIDFKKQEYQKSYSKEIEKENKDVFPEISLYVEAIKPSNKSDNQNTQKQVITQGTLPEIQEKQYSEIIPKIVDNAYDERIKFQVNNVNKSIANSDNKKILNIGCGNCYPFDHESFSDLDILHIDTVDQIPTSIRSRVNFKLMDAHNLPFKDKEFNCCILGDTLEHVIDPVQTLKEAKRVCNNIYITVPNEYGWDKVLEPFQNKSHIRHYTNETLIQDLNSGLGKDSYNIHQYYGGGWSFWCVEYETTLTYKKPLIYAVTRCLYGEDVVQQSIKSITDKMDKIFVFWDDTSWGDVHSCIYKGNKIEFPKKFDNVVDKIKELNNPKIVLIYDHVTNNIGQYTHLVNNYILPNYPKPDYLLFFEVDMVFRSDQLNKAFEEFIKKDLLVGAISQVEMWYDLKHRMPDRFRLGACIWNMKNLDKMPPTARLANPAGPGGIPPFLNAYNHNLGYSISPKVMYWKHMLTIASSPVIGDSIPNEDWYEDTWLKWDYNTNNKNLEVSQNAGYEIQRANKYDTDRLPEVIIEDFIKKGIFKL